jgi:membrane peptidoglycan carboxypeptidase
MKLELGSTAKLRTLAHYLELVTELYQESRELDRDELFRQIQQARDPITQWVRQTVYDQPAIDLPALLDNALDRKYSGNPGEVFFTGGGAHVFANFERNEDGAIFTLREGLQRSVNLVYIRLMRDIVRFHQARLPYDPTAVLNDLDNPVRQQKLTEIADQESKHFLNTAYRDYREQTTDDIVEKILGQQRTSPRKLAMLYLAWNADATYETLLSWLQSQKTNEPYDAERLYKSYDPHRLTLEDFAYLLKRHPLEIWCAGQIVNDPTISWTDLLSASADARKTSSEWLFRTKNWRAQDIRLRIRIEKDAFRRMLPYWQRFGFPFDHLVPSLATAIGSSADRPVALAELMGIILNDGVRLPTMRVEQLHFATDTPYETDFQADMPKPDQVMNPSVARALREVLASVVQNGTATRVRNTFADKRGAPITVGGKTGSGDNRFKTFSRGGGLKSARAVSRTGTFVFYIGDRYFGVLTAYVAGDKADRYIFTSALPVAVLKLLAPTIESALDDPAAQTRLQVADAPSAVSGRR